jgi:hypothetical protein
MSMTMMRGAESSSFMARRFNRKVTLETEATSTTDTDVDGSRDDSDTLSDSSLEGNGVKSTYGQPPKLDFESISEDTNALTSAFALQTADPFDIEHPGRVPPVFSEQQIFKARTRPAEEAAIPTGYPDVRCNMPPMPMQAVQMGPEPTFMPPMGMPMGMPPMVAPQSSAPSAGAQFMVPMPIPAPMQFPMPTMMPQVPVPVPKGWKLVRIPGSVPEPAAPAAKPAISDQAVTEQKIFVGGLNPATTARTLREYFSDFGPVLDAKVIREGEKSKGFGFVQFRDSIPAEVLEGSHIIDQRRCGVGPAVHRTSSD